MANILVVEDEKMAKAIEPYRNQLPHLKCIIVYDGKVPENSNDVISWQDVMRLGKEDNDDGPMLERQKNMSINQCCILVYTSGTTGNPKGTFNHNLWISTPLQEGITEFIFNCQRQF